jgi:hypothetical protein
VGVEVAADATEPDPSLSRYWEQGVDLLWGQIGACMTSIERISRRDWPGAADYRHLRLNSRFVRVSVMIAVAAFSMWRSTLIARLGRTAQSEPLCNPGESGRASAARAKLPTDAGLNMTAQKYFEQRGLASSKFSERLA